MAGTIVSFGGITATSEGPDAAGLSAVAGADDKAVATARATHPANKALDAARAREFM
ncbi:hypothetical protein OG900_18890 [Streptomyces sp. NBC_00433]